MGYLIVPHGDLSCATDVELAKSVMKIKEEWDIYTKLSNEGATIAANGWILLPSDRQ